MPKVLDSQPHRCSIAQGANTTIIQLQPMADSNDRLDQIHNQLLRLTTLTVEALDDLVRSSGGKVAHVHASTRVNLLRDLAREIEGSMPARRSRQ